MSDDLVDAGTSVHATPGLLNIVLPGIDLDIFIDDRSAEIDPTAAATEWFAVLDANKDGMLDTDEAAPLTQAGLRFEEIDKNTDHRLSLEELRESLGKQRSYCALQVMARVGPVEDPLFSWLDTNRDGRLTTGETTAGAERLAELDRDRDGEVTLAEIPNRLACGILRGQFNRREPVRPTHRKTQR